MVAIPLQRRQVCGQGGQLCNKQQTIAASFDVQALAAVDQDIALLTQPVVPIGRTVAVAVCRRPECALPACCNSAGRLDRASLCKRNKAGYRSAHQAVEWWPLGGDDSDA